MSNSRRSKVAMVTGGGGRRVGSVVALALAEDGYDIALHYHRSVQGANEVAETVRSKGVDCHLFQADVSVESDVNRMFLEMTDRFGRIDVLVTTASIWRSFRLEEVTAEEMLRSYGVNALGTFLCAKQAGLTMIEQAEGGSIVTIGDWAIQRPYLDHLPYFVAKGTIEAMTRSLAVELAHRNPKVRVNCIHPGPVLYPPDTSEAERKMLVESTLVKDGNCPESIARTVKYFVEEPFVTGVCMCVDGGRSIYAGEATSRKQPI